MVTLGPDELVPQIGQGQTTFAEGRRDDEFVGKPIRENEKIFVEHMECANIEPLEFLIRI